MGGANWTGKLGDGTEVDRLTPVAIVEGLRFRQVSAGGQHTCGVTTDDRAYCWASNISGELGDGTLSWQAAAVLAGLRFRRVDAGSSHSCGVTTDNRTYCWGESSNGQLGDGTQTRRQRPVAVVSGRSFKQVSAGSQHTCGVTTENRAYCWGTNRLGQIGDSSTAVVRKRPTRVAGAHHFRQLDAGMEHTAR